MKIILAKEIGYCMGVKRAMALAFKALSSPGRVFSHGPLIHNPAALDLMRSKGLMIYDPEAETLPGDTVVIRAHGLPPLEREKLIKKGVRIEDATCPWVAKIQKLTETEAKAGAKVLIWGTEGHPEVEGLLGYSLGRGLVIKNAEEIASLPDFEKVLLVAQTTQDPEAFEIIKEAVISRYGDKAKTADTICEATKLRQKDLKELVKKVGALCVAGGKDSGNTQRLKDIGLKAGLPTIAAEGPEDIQRDFPMDAETVGVAAGASTPIWQIRAVVQSLLAKEREESKSWGQYLRRFLRVLVLSNLYVGLGVGSLGWAMGEAMGAGYAYAFFALFFHFGLLMILLNGLVHFDHVRYNDPDRANFYIKYRKPLIFLCVATGILALFSSYVLGYKINILISVQMLAGFFCILPWNLFSKSFSLRGYRALKDVPFMKLISMSSGWSLLVVCPAFFSAPPLLNFNKTDLIKASFGLILVFLQVFTRGFIMNIEDARGDRTFSLATPAQILGPKRSFPFILRVMALWTLVILASYIWGGLGSLVLIFLATGPFYNLLVLRRYFKNDWLGGFQFDLLLDAQFLLSGLAGVLYWLILS
jgi:4-hydroxy-3-methylbut-2-enyl diphosphate reductase